jgi:hypothetical protein
LKRRDAHADALSLKSSTFDAISFFPPLYEFKRLRKAQ